MLTISCRMLRASISDGNINGVWNLVLACRNCNRGENGKWDQIPSAPLLGRLHVRNEYLIHSHHPLRETLIQQTGTKTAERAAFLQKMHSAARELRIHVWEPEQRSRSVFHVD